MSRRSWLRVIVFGCGILKNQKNKCANKSSDFKDYCSNLYWFFVTRTKITVHPSSTCSRAETPLGSLRPPQVPRGYWGTAAWRRQRWRRRWHCSWRRSWRTWGRTWRRTRRIAKEFCDPAMFSSLAFYCIWRKVRYRNRFCNLVFKHPQNEHLFCLHRNMFLLHAITSFLKEQAKCPAKELNIAGLQNSFF